MSAPDPIAIAARLAAHARAGGDALRAEDRRTSFGELAERSERIAGVVLQEGWAPGDVVGVAIGDEALHFAAAVALLALAAPQVCLPAHETDASNSRTTTLLGVALVLTDRPLGWAEGVRTIGLTPEALAAAPLGGFARAVEPGRDAPAVYVKTSGSTSAPKLFALSFARLLDGAARCATDPAAHCVMRMASMEFDSTRLQRLFAAIAGLPTAVAPRNMAELGRVCARLDVTQVHMGAYQLASLMRADRAPDPLPDGTSLLSGGSRVPGPLRAEVAARLTPALFVSYATSEVGPISMATPDEHEAWPEGVGRPRPDAVVEVVDETGVAVDRGQVGEIRVRRPAAPRAYVGEPSGQFRDGWFYPRDLVSWPADGPLVHHGRADDVMLLNGVKISGDAIEDALTAHPAVREAAAYPVRSRLHGEIPAAAVTIRAQGETPDAAALLAHCRAILGLRAPRRIVILDEIPRTATGKPIRRQLSEL